MKNKSVENWECAVDGSTRKLPDGRCAMCGRGSAAESKRYADQWDKAARHPKPQYPPTPMYLRTLTSIVHAAPKKEDCEYEIVIGRNSAEQFVAVITGDALRLYQDMADSIVRAVNAHEELVGLLAEGIQRARELNAPNGMEDFKAWAQDAQEIITKAEGK